MGDLLLGPHVELNLLGRGNNCLRLAGTKTLKPGAIYILHVIYDADVSDSSDEKDEFTVGTISDVCYKYCSKSRRGMQINDQGSLCVCS